MDQGQIASASGVGINTIRNMEAAGAGSIRARTETLDAVEGLLKRLGVTFLPGNGQGHGVRFMQVPQIDDDTLLGKLLDQDQFWIIRLDSGGVEQANSLRRTLEKVKMLADTGSYITTIRDLSDRTIIHPDQIRRLLIRLGLFPAYEIQAR
jgi:hypothetical protein